MRRVFWRLDRKNERFHKSLSHAHSNFFKNIMPDKRRSGAVASGLGTRTKKLLKDKLEEKQKNESKHHRKNA